MDTQKAEVVMPKEFLHFRHDATIIEHERLTLRGRIAMEFARCAICNTYSEENLHLGNMIDDCLNMAEIFMDKASERGMVLSLPTHAEVLKHLEENKPKKEKE